MHRSIFHRGVSAFIFILLVIFAYGNILDTQALSVTQRKDILSRLKVGTLSNHTIEFTAINGVAVGETVTVLFPIGFSIPGALDYTDVDVSYGPFTGTENELAIAAAAGGGAWGASFTGQTLTLTAGTVAIPAGSRIAVEVGTNATIGTVGDLQITNPAIAGEYVLIIGGTFGGDGEIAVPIINDDQAGAVAAVSPMMVFDLDIGTAVGESTPPYTFDLGTLTAGQVVSSGTGIPERPRIMMELKTTAAGGAIVTIEGINGGIKSASQNHIITTTDSGSAVTLDGSTEGFGACVASVSAISGTIEGVAPYNGACSISSHEVGGITTAPRTIVDTANGPALGTDNNSAQIFLKTSITPTTPAANDYSEIISFVATGTF